MCSPLPCIALMTPESSIPLPGIQLFYLFHRPLRHLPDVCEPRTKCTSTSTGRCSAKPCFHYTQQCSGMKLLFFDEQQMEISCLHVMLSGLSIWKHCTIIIKNLKTLPSYTVKTLKKELKRTSLCLSWNNGNPFCRFYSPQHRQWGSLQYLRHRKSIPTSKKLGPTSTDLLLNTLCWWQDLHAYFTSRSLITSCAQLLAAAPRVQLQ